MKTCNEWQRVCDAGAEPDDPGLAAHLAGCAECRAALAKWRAIAVELPASLNARPEAFPVRDGAVLAGVRRRLPRNRGRAALRWAWAPAAAAAAVAAVVLVAQHGADAPTPARAESPAIAGTLVRSEGAAAVAIAAKPGSSLEVPPGGRAELRIGAHRIAVGGDTSLRLAAVAEDRVALELARGGARFDVDFGPRGGRFTVAAGDVLVTVKGTIFTVSRDARGVIVDVAEGRVAVSREGEELAVLTAGDRLETGASTASSKAAAEPPADSPRPREAGAAPQLSRSGNAAAATDTAQATEAPPDLETLRRWVVDGRLTEAEAGLTALVARRPTDVEAWWTLGDCRRLDGRPAEAVDAYRRVIAIGPADQADLARLKAGALLQERLGRHADAVALYEEYLRGKGASSSLRAEVLVRCGRSLVALGRDADARPMLREVVERYPANPVAGEARALLEKSR
jgi:transmembrane sensor